MKVITGLKQYQDEAEKTLHPDSDVIYLAGKLVCEATEILQPLLKGRYHGKPVDLEAIYDELGDCLWYLSAMCSEYGMELEEIATRNITKLRERHGEHYNPTHYRKDG